MLFFLTKKINNIINIKVYTKSTLTIAMTRSTIKKKILFTKKKNN